MGIICNFIYNTLVKNLRTYSLCPLFKYRYGIRAGQTFLSLIRFIENSRNICISKEVYYENRFNDVSKKGQTQCQRLPHEWGLGKGITEAKSYPRRNSAERRLRTRTW
jgi:hypothetical protein